MVLMKNATYFEGLICDSCEDSEEQMDELYTRVESILKEDDVDEFKKFVENEKEISNNYDSTSCLLLDLCLSMVARKCTVHMLKAEDVSRSGSFSVYVLSDVAVFWVDLHVLQTMFDFADAAFLANQCDDIGFLPIHYILIRIMEDVPFSKWFKGNSIIKLIVMLITAREVRPKLKCARLVAQNTTSIVNVALGFVEDGDVKELAALLLLCYDEIFETFKARLPTVSDEYYDDGPQDDFSTDLYELIYLFDKVGRDLSNLYNSTSENDCISICELADSPDKPTEMILKVATLIKNAGFPITYADIDLEHEFSYKYGVINKICEPLGVELDDGKDGSDRNHRFPSVYCMPRKTSHINDAKFFRHRQIEHIYQHQARQYFSTAPQNYKFSPRKSSSSPSLRSATFLAMGRLTRVVKLL